MRLITTASFTLLVTAVPALLATTAADAPAQEAELACVIMQGDRAGAAERTSPLDSVSFQVDGGAVKVCYGRPSARGREIMGGLLPFGQLWRTGANEPTMIHTSVPLSIAGIEVEPGTYSLYTVPGESEWEIIVNASVSQWGHEGRYTEEVKAQELGRATVPAASTDEMVEQFTIHAEPQDAGTHLVLEWENTRVAIPLMPAGMGSH